MHVCILEWLKEKREDSQGAQTFNVLQVTDLTKLRKKKASLKASLAIPDGLDNIPLADGLSGW